MMRTENRQRAYDLTQGCCIYCDVSLTAYEDMILIDDGEHVDLLDGQSMLCVTLQSR